MRVIDGSERTMDMNSPRLDDTFCGAALAVIVAVVISICSTLVSVGVDTNASVAAQMATPVQAIASIAVNTAH
jgi:hypothetical protein